MLFQQPYTRVCILQAPAADDAFGNSDYTTSSTPSTKSSGDFGSDSASSQKVTSGF